MQNLLQSAQIFFLYSFPFLHFYYFLFCHLVIRLRLLNWKFAAENDFFFQLCITMLYAK